MLECFIISLSSRAFLDEVSSSLDSEANSSLTEVVAVLHVLAVVKRSEFFQMKCMMLFFLELSISEAPRRHGTVCFTVSHPAAGRCEAALKAAATSLHRHLNSHAAASVDGSDVQRQVDGMVLFSMAV